MLPAAALLILLLWLFVQPSTPTQKKDFVQAVGVLLAALAGLGGLYFTWQGQKLTRENTEKQLQQARKSTNDQLQQARESLERTQRLTEQGQITERFTRAIEQLGATDDKGKKLEIRLGGIYALERIDKESPERAYHGTVMEVLTAYVRENSRREDEAPSITSTASNEGVEQDTEVAQKQDVQPSVQRLPTDIQAILDVLNRREEEGVPEEHHVLLDLREADLQGADLKGAFLSRANLQGAILLKANLRAANLYEANLQEADLRFVILEGAFLEGANLQGAQVTDKQLADTLSLQGATMPNGSKHP